jgi:hypothetical protein
LLCDIINHLSGLNTKLQGEQKLIFDKYGAVKSFLNEAETISETYGKYLPCDLLHTDGPVSVPFPSVRALEMFTLLSENLKWDLVTFAAVLRIHVSLKTCSPLKSAILQKNCNLN